MKNENRAKKVKIRYGIMAASLAAFLVILYFVASEGTSAFDTAVTSVIYPMRSGALTAVFCCITYLGNWQSVTLLCLILLAFRQTRRNFGIPVSIGAVTVTVLNKIIKMIVQRPRPDVSLHLIEQGGYSFPSGHSITGMLVFGLLIYLVRSHVENRTKANILTALLCIPMIFIGISRIYLGVHYPTDVLGGWMLAIALLMAMMNLLERKNRV